MLGQACAHPPLLLVALLQHQNPELSGPAPPLAGATCALVQAVGLHPKPQGVSALAFLYVLLCRGP